MACAQNINSPPLHHRHGIVHGAEVNQLTAAVPNASVFWLITKAAGHHWRHTHTHGDSSHLFCSSCLWHDSIIFNFALSSWAQVVTERSSSVPHMMPLHNANVSYLCNQNHRKSKLLTNGQPSVPCWNTMTLKYAATIHKYPPCRQIFHLLKTVSKKTNPLLFFTQPKSFFFLHLFTTIPKPSTWCPVPTHCTNKSPNSAYVW